MRAQPGRSGAAGLGLAFPELPRDDMLLPYENDGFRLTFLQSRIWRLSLGLALAAVLSTAPSLAAEQQRISARVSQQIQALLAEKATRTPSERKMSSRLLYEVRRHQRKSFAPGLESLSLRESAAPGGRVLVDIEALPQGSKALIERLQAIGAEVVHASISSGDIRAYIPTGEAEGLARMPELLHIRLGRAPVVSKVNTSEADVAHRVAEARTRFGARGGGVKVGVLSNGLGPFQTLQDSGDLPPGITILPGQEGFGTEGSAMMELIHDLAPDAQLYFATGALGRAAYAENILKLREAGCDVLVDDLFYVDESPFQDGDVAQAVQSVVEDGALYFSAVGNDGNKAYGTSSTWEGDFRDGGALPLLGNGRILDFGDGGQSNQLTSDASQAVTLHWTDPAGRSDNDYDLFVLDASLTRILEFSTNVQDGDDDPYEEADKAFSGERIVILKHVGAADRFLHLALVGGHLAISTQGCARGHSAARGAFAVSAVDVETANSGVFTGGAANPVESFACDGPRRVFFGPDGTPITPGDFSATGGEVRQKPDFAAADGTVTATRGFERFFGTSAAAPHAAAIAALARSIFPDLSAERFREAVAASALDIDAPGVDVNSGHGLLMAVPFLEALGAEPSALLSLGGWSAIEREGDGDTYMEPGETIDLGIVLRNIGGGPAVAVSATLATTAPGVSIVTAAGDFPDLAAGDARGGSSHFTLRLDPGLVCGLVVPLRLTAVYEGGHASSQSFDLDLFTGKPKPAAVFRYRGAPLPIPDADEVGEPGVPLEVPIVVQGVEGRILNLSFRIDGTSCTTVERATTVGIDHPFATDLTLTLQSPSGTVVKLFENADLSGNNFCQTLLEDEAGRSILEVKTADAPFNGRFRPQETLAAFKGEDPNGTWILRVTDSFPNDSGHVRAVSLLLSAADCASETCDAGSEALSLQGGRFKVETCFKNQHAGDAVGVGRPRRLSDQSGLFWFFSPENPEVLVKVLDGTAVNERYWVYAGALSDLDYIVKFTDTETGRIRSYHNPPGGVCGLGDVVTFAPAGAQAEASPAVRPPVHAEPLPDEGPASGSCVPGDGDLCLLEGRFRVQVRWRDRASGLEGEGFALPHGDGAGIFWFFDPANVELGVKMVDGRPVSGTFWLYYGALTGLDYTLTVTDTTTGTTRSYAGPPGQICGGVDAGVFGG